MSPLDWLLIVGLVSSVMMIGIKTRKYTQDVSDFLAGGRVAGRYVLAVAGYQAGMGLITVVAMWEMCYQAGFAVGFWGGIAAPINIIIALTGFVTYRFRETRAMTLAQFFEMRYSRNFRIFTGFLQAIAGIVNYGLFPAVGARFFIYYANLPFSIEIGGVTIPTYALVMAIFLGIAVLVSCVGGLVAIMVANAVQGVLCYPMYVTVVVAIMCQFSWWDHLVPVMANRPPGQSFINPFDTHQLRDFNLFYIFVGIFASIYNIRSWQGTQGFSAAAVNPHEQKMAGVLGGWSAGFAGIMYVFLAMAALAYMQHADFKARALQTQTQLDWKVLNDVAPAAVASINEPNAETIQQVQEQLPEKQKQVFKTIRSQMLVPVALRDILPIGVSGMLCAIMLFLMVSTDATYLHSWSSILVQDIFLPLYKKPLGVRRHLWLLRLGIIAVAAYAFVFSLFFGQVTYILMFFALTGSLWLGGAGAVIIGGLYWKRGTTAGAWASVIGGGLFALVSFICTQFWADWLYPMLAQRPEALAWFTKIIEGISRPFEPIILWRVSPTQFPINGQELFFLNMLFSIGLYVVCSLLTCREPFNMDRLLHRGAYARKDEAKAADSDQPMTFRQKCYKLFIGIDAQYTRGDKILAWTMFWYSFGWGYGTWMIILIWNLIYRWPTIWWARLGFFNNYILGIAIGVISTVWFFIGASIDLKKLFYRLANRQRNVADDGRVIGHISADEVQMVEQIEHRKIQDQ